ncbi:hypothetical protein ACFWQC_02045 [Nocardioides sp. NPDC058538]|uniref:hypothetical protein n=1 Tax=Nocardioides sp. NPDC058538 TaxID=3346542 RepID=UPI00364D4773
MRREFASALALAAEQPLASERIRRIKRAVTDEVRLADPAVTVRFTDYFNNVAVPDLVLRWPAESRERLVFLRPLADPDWLNDELSALAPHEPMIFTLEDIGGPHDGPHEQRTASIARLAAHASLANTWVADASAIASIGESRRDSAVIGLLGQALVRGGRGVSSGNEMRDLTLATESAFQEAETLQRQPVAAGIRSMESALQPDQASRITRVLRAVWEGHGGSGADFPTTATTGPLSDDDLRYLMTSLDDAPGEFWRRVGRTVTTEQLGRIALTDPSQSLQNLVAVHLGRLTAKGLRVTDREEQLLEPDRVPRWVIDRKCLAIRGSNWIAHIAARKADELPAADDSPQTDLDELRRRAITSESVVTRIEFGKGDRVVSYESKERADVLADVDLERVAADVPGLSVARAVLSLRQGGQVHADFSTSTAVAPTSSTIELGALIRAAIPLFLDQDAADWSRTQGNRRRNEPATLFDWDDEDE